jgi:glycine cleavage system H lipoate-binding protein
MVALFVLAVFIFFIVLDFIVLKFQGKTHPAFEKVLSIPAMSILPGIEIVVPGDILLTKGHLWMKKNKPGLIKLGIDEFIINTLGKISIQNNFSAGQKLRAGDVLFESRIGNKKLKFHSPVNGIVKSINSSHADKGSSNPYSNWCIELLSNDFAAVNVMSFSGNNALNWLKQEFIKLDNFLMKHAPGQELAGVTMHDGGKIIENASSDLIKNNAEDFEKEFLSF